MESFLRRKLGNLPDVCSSFYSVAEEPFPQVLGILDDTVEQSFLSNQTTTASNSPACILSTHKNQDDLTARNETTNNSDLNFSQTEACSHLAEESTCTKSLQNEKNIVCLTINNDLSNCPSVFTSSLEKSDSLSGELKNSTFDVTQNVKEGSGINTTDTGINATVDLQNFKETNTTYQSVQSQEPRKTSDARLNSTVDIDVPITKTCDATIDLVQTSNAKEVPGPDVNATVDISNVDCTHEKIQSDSDNSEPSNTTTEQSNEKHDGTTDIQVHELEEKQDVCLNSTSDANVNSSITKNSVETNVNGNVTVEVVEQTDSATVQASGDVQPSLESVKPAEVTFTKLNTTTELTVPDVPILKNTTIEIKSSSTEATSQANDGTNSVLLNAEKDSNNREAEVEISTPAFVRSVETSLDSPKSQVEECPPITLHGTADPECIQNSSTTSRSSIFCLDDTLDMKTSFMVTSTPIIFSKESRFEILEDLKTTPRRKRLSVINSIEAHSRDELVGTSHHDGTVAQVTQSSNGSQKVSTHCTSGQSTSEPANENNPPTKPVVKRQLPQLSSKLCYPKSGLPPRPQSSMNSSAAVRPKTVQMPIVPNPPDVSSTLFGNKKSGPLNKVKNIANVKNTPSAGTVKTSSIPSVSGNTFTAVSKPSSSGVPQMRPSGLHPPTRKRLALKTPPTTRTSVETVQPLSSNKPPGFPGMRTRNSLLPSVGQKHLNNDGLPSAKRKRIAPSVLATFENEAGQPVKAHGSDCSNCSHHHEKLERYLEEIGRLRSECKNWGPLLEKLEMRVEEWKRI